MDRTARRYPRLAPIPGRPQPPCFTSHTHQPLCLVATITSDCTAFCSLAVRRVRVRVSCVSSWPVDESCFTVGVLHVYLGSSYWLSRCLISLIFAVSLAPSRACGHT